MPNLNQGVGFSKTDFGTWLIAAGCPQLPVPSLQRVQQRQTIMWRDSNRGGCPRQQKHADKAISKAYNLHKLLSVTQLVSAKRLIFYLSDTIDFYILHGRMCSMNDGWPAVFSGCAR